MDTSSPSPKGETAELLFVPIPFTGHIMSTVEIAKLLVDRDHRLFITIFLINLPFDPNATAYARTVASSLTQPRIRFIHLLPPNSTTTTSPSNTSFSPAFMHATVEQNKQPLRDEVANLIINDPSRRVMGFVIDVLCFSMIAVADEFNVPSYFYDTSCASFLDLSLRLLDLYDERKEENFSEVINSGIELAVPSFSSPVPVGKLIPFLTEGVDAAYRFVSVTKSYRIVKGVLINTFVELESKAVESLLKGGEGIPQIYPVGPILNQAIGKQDRDVEKTVVDWLDLQPASSVLFLCFGSMGCFEEDQLKEIAFGIEKSGYRFIWSIRRPPMNGGVNPDDYADPEEALPEGFLKRTAEIGKVIGWAPQVEVLSHTAIGGFVSHCGWNSVLESVRFGVPIATWPLYAEQQVNAFTLARELGLAAEITVDYKRDLKNGKANFLVKAEEIQRGIRDVMEKESEMRKKMKTMMVASLTALQKDGSSYTWLGRFIEDVFNNMTFSS